MTLTQDQRDIICKAYEVATDIKELGVTLGLKVSFIIDEDLWVRAYSPRLGFDRSSIIRNFLGVTNSLQAIAVFGEHFREVIKSRTPHE